MVDQHGVPRGKMLSPQAAIAAMSDGLDFSGAIYSLDTGNQVFVPAFAAGGGFGIEEFTGFPDVVLVPDPATFRVLPWADRTGWMLCDVVLRQRAADAAGRARAAAARARVARRGGISTSWPASRSSFTSWFVLKRRSRRRTPASRPPPPPVSVFERGYQYLSEVRLDGMGRDLESVRDALDGIGLLPRSMEDEWGPGQLEFSFSPITGLAAADAAVLFRSAVKQVCQRRGLLATFMCRPALPNFFSSGWHLHQSLLNRPDGANVFAADDLRRCRTLGRRYVAGLLEHAVPMAVFAAPTVNGYKRFRPYSFAPGPGVLGDGEPRRAGPGPGLARRHQQPRGDAPRRARREPVPVHGVEHRGWAGRHPAEPGAAASGGGRPVRRRGAAAAHLAGEAVEALDADRFYRSAFGDTLVDYLVMMKRAEIRRYEDALAAETGAGRPGRQRLGDAGVLRVLLIT